MTQERYAFVIRLWNEARKLPAKQQPVVELRGSLQVADSDEVYYFDSLEKIPELLRQVTGWEPEAE